MSKKDRILKIPRKSAEQEAQKILDKAREQSREMEKKAESEMEKERERRLKALMDKLSVERARRIGEADHLREEKILKAEHEVVGKIVSDVEGKLRKVRDDS